MALTDPQTEIPQLTKHRWHYIGVLGSGGQGTVYKVRSQQANMRLIGLHAKVGDAITYLPASRDSSQLVEAIRQILQDEPPDTQGALKVLRIKDHANENDAKKATKRFEKEVEALRNLQQHPDILRILDADVAAHWMVTELQSGSTLADSPDRFKGKPLEALRAFRPLVATVATLHAAEARYIHRDIKPANIFFSSSGGLILGDFGIVFSEDGRDRPTDTFEKVGPRDWMAPWANLGKRIDDVKPTFDVFSLGKILWFMVSGQHMLPLWYFDDPKYDQYRLTSLFRDVPHIDTINDILRHCVVQHEDDCAATAGDLLKLVDQKLSILERGGHVLRLDTPRPCRVCGRGQYVLLPSDGQDTDRVIPALRGDIFMPPKPYHAPSPLDPYFNVGTHSFWFRLLSCDQCGHVQLFLCPERGKLPPAWEMPLT